MYLVLILVFCNCCYWDWLKVAQTSPLGLVEKIILLRPGPECPRMVHFTLLRALRQNPVELLH